ncbi:MAG: T9SS type A sorting domain-containing protein [Saprospiraceae bacterium]|nr:T9SS type A sorting domain-containing protein [Saprospiraceae bacterium]
MKFFKLLSLLMLALLSISSLRADSIVSAQSGDWNNPGTWIGNQVPTSTDDVTIDDNHIVTLTGSAYTHTGNLLIKPLGEFVANMGTYHDGLILKHGTTHVFGKLTMPFPVKDLRVGEGALFWGHDGAEIFISDDWRLSGKSETVVHGICVEVDDDFVIESQYATLCGTGNVSIGVTPSINHFTLKNGATDKQVCKEVGVYRGSVQGLCSVFIQNGKGNNSIVALDDATSTEVNQSIPVDVLNMGIPDYDPNPGDQILIMTAGLNSTNDNATEKGGTVTINRNGTPTNPTDDFIDYTPPADYVGKDKFTYTTTDRKGGYDAAEVIVDIQFALPVELVDFIITAKACTAELEWVTASEENNDYFEIQRSRDGVSFEAIAKVEGQGTTDKVNSYKFVDSSPLGKNYYRLKQVDFNGQFDYSETLVHDVPCASNGFDIGITKAFPNPIGSGEINVIYEALDSDNKTVIISNSLGVVVDSYQLDLLEGRNILEINTDVLATGTYYVTIGKSATRFQKIGMY